ncbi:branched-chain amino acid aminotransferase [Reichenbachiella agariperforans]|uniref:branched-chain amino acid aminotransferase n=1 Tax=Reichenbachiella agariperforans TaxID=156994 RepID=UPI001C090E35|nr:branched-chain amino acid aminotransferase [Reichenbachiella agariperforans]MBU2912782.1 branched-chain amino acid aminotransferase [Reichenbachiella agariperforans]
MSSSTIDFDIKEVAQSKINEVDFNHIEFGKVYSDHMFAAEYEDGEWKNFRIEPYGDLSISPANATLHYAQSVFEGLKAYKDDQGAIRIFRPDANAKRMVISAERMCIPPIPEDLFMEALTELLKLDAAWIPTRPDTSLYIRPVIFANDPYVGIRPSMTYKFLIFTGPVGAYYSEPVNVKIEKKYTRAASGGVGFAKTAGNYAASLYPAMEALKEGYHQLIWTDGKEHEYIEEAGTMNLLFYINDTLITAPAGDSILNGITKDSVLTLARDWGMKVEERRLTVTELIAALEAGTVQEAFGAGTAATISKIKMIGNEGKQYQLPTETPLADKLFSELDDIKMGRKSDPHGWVFTL